MNRPMAGRASTASPYAVNPHQTAQHRPYQVVSGPVRRAPVAASAQALRAESSTPIRYAQPPLGYKIGNQFDLSEIKRSNEKSKGLRHFSSKVCEKVKEKGRTNYNEVADELVHEYFETQALHINDEKNQYDMKNIRRRVYDALNVLLAMNIIEKNKKDIHWVGLPTSSAQEMKRLEEDKVRRMERIREKSETLQEMIMQLVAYKTLVDKNREIERAQGRPSENSVLYLPFVMVNTERGSAVEVSVAHDKSEFLFDFDRPFEINDDVEVLKRLGLAQGLDRGTVEPSERDRIRRCLPHALSDYVDQIIDGNMMQEMARQSTYLVPEKQQPSGVYESPRGENMRIIRRVGGMSDSAMDMDMQSQAQAQRMPIPMQEETVESVEYMEDEGEAEQTGQMEQVEVDEGTGQEDHIVEGYEEYIEQEVYP